ncbi:hypothetical protein [Streptomyces sp. NPDC088725]|uniref:hypothetical protein n=1 Tax=Streptomyces sp. NPDC088725 TaxID=3365873 RepID=UPI00380A5CE0
MGIESDQLVYDYLSRVGDVAQQQQLPSGERMKLVSTLRNEIDQQRGKFGGDSPAVVRRILGRMGDPEVLVRTASTNAVRPQAAPEPQGPAVPEQRTGWGTGSRLRKQAAGAEVPGQRGPEQPAGSAGPAGFTGLGGPAGPSGLDGLSGSGSGAGLDNDPDWWRVQAGPMGGSLGVPGFVGGLEIPDMLKSPTEDGPEDEAAPADGTGRNPGGLPGGGSGGGPAGLEKASGRRWRPRLRRRGGEGRAGGLTNPFLLLAAALLVVGALLGSWLALGGGWLFAYASRKLSRTEAKLAVFGLPGVSVAGGLVWLWGRMNNRWGDPIPQDGMAAALQETWPVVVRTAAVASALYLVWRSRRRA